MNRSSYPQPSPFHPDDSDNSRFWVAGGLYVNPNDPRLFVLKRSRTGWTFNYAHPVAWWISVGFFVVLGLIQLLFFIIFHNIINLVLLCFFLACCFLLLIAGIHIRTSSKA